MKIKVNKVKSVLIIGGGLILTYLIYKNYKEGKKNAFANAVG